MKGALCGEKADCLACEQECEIKLVVVSYGDLLVENHILKDKLVGAGKKIGELVKAGIEREKELKSLRRKLELAGPMAEPKV